MHPSAKLTVTTKQGWWLCLLITLAVYGLPILAGFSWLPTPEFARQQATRTGYDTFSFPYFDLPFREAAWQSLRRGDLPLWNPNVALGVPMAAQYQNQIFSPFEWIDLLLHNTWLWNISLLIRIALGGWGAFLLARRLWHDDLTGLIAGTLYTLSAYFIGFQSIAAFINGAVLLPWLLLSINVAFSAGSYIPKASFIGAVFGLAAVSGQPQIALINLGVATVYGLVALGSTKGEGRWRGLLVIVVGGLLAAAIASPQLAAFREGLQNGYTIHSPGSYSGGGTTQLNLVTPFMPMLLGPIMEPWMGSLFPSKLNAEGFPLLLGAALTFALCLGIVRVLLSKTSLPWQDSIHGYCALFLLLCFVGAVVSSTMGWANLWSHPLINRINLPRYGAPLAALLIAQIAAVGLSSVACRQHRLSIIFSCVATLVLLGLTHWIAWPVLTAALAETNAPLRHASILISETTGWTSLFGAVLLLLRGKRESISAAVGCLILISGELSFCVRYGFNLNSEFLRLIPWALTVVAGLAWGWQQRRLAMVLGAASALILFGLVLTAPQSLDRAHHHYAESEPQLEFLQKRLGRGSILGRVLTSQWVMTPNTLAAFGVNQMGGLNPLQPILAADWFREALTTKQVNYTLPVAWHGMIDSPDYPSWEDYDKNRLIYNFMGVRLLAETRRGELSALALPDLNLVRDSPEGRIWEDTRVWPRAFLAQGPLISAHSNSEAQALALNSRHKSEFPYLILTGAGERLKQWAPARTQLSISAVSRFDQQANRAYIESVCTQPALLVVTDVWYPGWKAKVDGIESIIWPVQGLVRGVFLPAGSHTVEFRYSPDWLTPCLLLMSLGWTAVLSGAVIFLRNVRFTQKV